MNTIQQDPKSNSLSLKEAITAAENRPLWRLILHLALRTPSGACQIGRKPKATEEDGYYTDT